jgi:hypothetical protein
MVVGDITRFSPFSENGSLSKIKDWNTLVFIGIDWKL